MLTNYINRAREFAIKAHGDQRYGVKPYVCHLDDVADLVASYGDTFQVVAYLHDVLEDTATTIEQIRNEFGSEVADSVSLLTDEKGETRKIRKAKTNAKLESTDDTVALAVKAADRLANMRESISEDAGKLEMYRKEHVNFMDAVYRIGLCNELWREMDEILNA